MREEENRPEGRAQARVAGRAPGVPGAAGGRRAHPAVPSLQETLTAALRRRVAQRAARDHGAHPPLVGYLCERLPGSARAPRAARAVGWGDGRLCGVPAGAACKR